MTRNSVHLQGVSRGVDARTIFDRLCDFTAYPNMAPSVLSVTVEPVRDPGEGTQLTTWEVSFRGGVLSWSEYERIDPQRLEISFSQVEGDMADFEGSWEVTEDAGDAVIGFRATFDLGIPTLADILNPVATRALEDNIEEIIEACVSAAGGSLVAVEGGELERAPRAA